MNDHDIVTIDQKQKLINKTEKYKNTRKENFFLSAALLDKTLRHEEISKFNYTVSSARVATVPEESALGCLSPVLVKFSPEL